FSQKGLRRRNDVAVTPVPLEVLPHPTGLYVLAPVADVPFAPGAEAAKLMGAVVDGHVDDRKTVMSVCGFQRSAQGIGVVAAGYSHTSRYGGGKPLVVDGNLVVGTKLALVLCDLQTGDGCHPAIVENHDHSTHTMLHGIDQNLRIHHERAIAAKGDG